MRSKREHDGRIGREWIKAVSDDIGAFPFSSSRLCANSITGFAQIYKSDIIRPCRLVYVTRHFPAWPFSRQKETDDAFGELLCFLHALYSNSSCSHVLSFGIQRVPDAWGGYKAYRTRIGLGEFLFPVVTFALVAHTALQVEQTTSICYGLFHCYLCFSCENIPLSSLAPGPMTAPRRSNHIGSLFRSPSPCHGLWTRWETR